MGKKKGSKNVDKQGKKPKKERDKKVWSKSNKYTIIENKPKRSNPFCPKCGPGIFLSSHKVGSKIRHHCGKCAYTEIKSVA